MDITLARTFLEIVETGSFAAAAARLNVGQSTVSMRIKALESELGRPLFQRSKAGIVLTRAGQHFQKPAADLLRVWTQARQEIALPEDVVARLALGGEISLWPGLLLDWIGQLQRTRPELAVRGEVGAGEALCRTVAEGQLDLAVVYTPLSRPGMQVEELFAEHLLLVSTAADRGGPADPGYVFIDWGPAFRAAHARAAPEAEMPRLTLAIGASARDYLLVAGGSGYLPARLATADLAAGRLHRVPEAPILTVPVYLACNTSSLQSDWIRPCLESLELWCVPSQETTERPPP